MTDRICPYCGEPEHPMDCRVRCTSPSREMAIVIDAIQADTTAMIVDMWPELPRRPVTRDEGELLNSVLMNLLSRLREQGVNVPDVAIVRVENVEAR